MKDKTEQLDRHAPEADAAERMAWAGEYMVPTELARKLERERDEARNQRDILRLDAQKEGINHDRMIGELERVYAERDEAREKLRMANIEANARQEIANALKERDETKEALANEISFHHRTHSELIEAQCKLMDATQAIIITLEENRHLADGDDCTLAKLKSVVSDWK